MVKRTTKVKTSDKKPKTKKVASRGAEPTEEEIRKKAAEIYQERVARGEYGTAEDDWYKAERILKGSKE